MTEPVDDTMLASRIFELFMYREDIAAERVQSRDPSFGVHSHLPGSVSDYLVGPFAHYLCWFCHVAMAKDDYLLANTNHDAMLSFLEREFAAFAQLEGLPRMCVTAFLERITFPRPPPPDVNLAFRAKYKDYIVKKVQDVTRGQESLPVLRKAAKFLVANFDSIQNPLIDEHGEFQYKVKPFIRAALIRLYAQLKEHLRAIQIKSLKRWKDTVSPKKDRKRNRVLKKRSRSKR